MRSVFGCRRRLDCELDSSIAQEIVFHSRKFRLGVAVKLLFTRQIVLRGVSCLGKTDAGGDSTEANGSEKVPAFDGHERLAFIMLRSVSTFRRECSTSGFE